MSLFTPRLLITDDDRDFRETVAGALADRGFETLQAADGEETLQIIGRQEVHLLLLDMQMPRLSGLETIERLRGIEMPWNVGWDKVAPATDGPPSTAPFSGAPAQSSMTGPIRLPLPWILISGALDEQLIARARAAAAFSVLPKPVRLPELTGAIAGALAQAYGWRAA
jgi:CheY-like chemotaxis protein